MALTEQERVRLAEKTRGASVRDEAAERAAVDLGDLPGDQPGTRELGDLAAPLNETERLQAQKAAMVRAGTYTPSAPSPSPVSYRPATADVAPPQPMPQAAPGEALPAAPGRGQRVAAGWVATQRQRQGSPLNPEERADVDASRDLQAKAVEAEVGGREQQAFQDEERAQLLAREADAVEASERVRQMRQDMEMAHHKLDLESAQREVQNTPAQDQDRWWHSKNTFGKLQTGLALILGGFGAGLQGRSNPVAAMVDRAIANDIDAQKVNARQSRERFGDAITFYELAQERWQHDDQRTLAARALAHESLIKRLDAEAAKAQTPQQQAQYAQLRAGLAKSLEQETLKLHELTADKIATHEAYRPAGIVGQGGDIEAMRKAFHEYTAKQLAEGQNPLPFASWRRVAWTGEGGQGGDLAAMTKAYHDYAAHAAQQGERPMAFEAWRKNAWTGEGDLFGAGGPSGGKAQRERTVNIEGRDYVAISTKQAEEAKVAIDEAREVLALNQRIRKLRSKSVLGPADRAELDALLDAGALHYPRMQTGSRRVNQLEIEMGKATYSGHGDWLRSDTFGRQDARLKAIDEEAEQRIRDAEGGLKPSGGGQGPAPAPRGAPAGFKPLGGH
jgi:hypothetical protein